MTKGLVAPISSKGQVTLPKGVRELLHVERGDYIRFEPKVDGVWVTKIRLEPEGFSENEWKTLERLARQKGKRYTDAKAFLKDLEAL